MTEHAIMEMSSHNNNNNLNRAVHTKYNCMMYKRYTKGKKSLNLQFLGSSTKRVLAKDMLS